MINDKTFELINSQINKEFYSAYLYLSFSTWLDNHGLVGFANWYSIQAQEERDHALLFMKYMSNNGKRVELDAIEKPIHNFVSAKEIIEEGLKHEQFVTASIYEIYDEAMKNKDYRTTQFLDWFVKEQGEEEKNAEDLLRRWQLYGEDSKSLYMLDAELATRVYTAPSLVI